MMSSMQQSWFFLCRFSSVGQSIRLITGRAQVRALQAAPKRQKKGGCPTELYNCDCMTILQKMPDKCIDLCLTDPPYGIGMDKGSGGYGHSANKKYSDTWDSDRPSKEYFDQILRVSKRTLIFGGNYFADLLPRSTEWIVWDKKCGRAFNNPFSDAELIWTSLNGRRTKIERFTSQGFITDSDDERVHPTQKPTELLQRLLQDYSKPGDLVLDCFMGSGSIGVACVREGRDFVGIERDERYYQIAKARIEQEQAAGKQLSFI